MARGGRLFPPQGRHQIRGGGKAIHRVLAQPAGQRGVATLRQARHDARRRLRLVHHDAASHRRHARSIECLAAAEHLVGDGSETEDIRRRADAISRDLLGGHVERRPRELAGGSGRRGLEMGDTEVHHLRRSVGKHHDVPGLHVAMDDALAMGVVERVGDTLEDR
jgi:hypothetical protein